MGRFRGLHLTPRVGSWLCLIVWCMGIFALSAQSHLEISNHELLDFILRKIAHACVFGVLLVLASMTLRQEGMEVRRARLLALVFTLLYAVSDEYHQSFVPGRFGTIRDVGIDTAGALIALGLLAVHSRHSTSVQDSA